MACTRSRINFKYIYSIIIIQYYLIASADGILKIWNVKKAICVSTVDKHEGKVWALDVSDPLKTGKQLVLTGDNSSLLCLWEDVTKEEVKT